MAFTNGVFQKAHPVDVDSYLPGATHEAIKAIVSTEPVDMAKSRLSVVYNLRELASELSVEESRRRSKMHPDVSKCTSSKSITVFAYILNQLDYWGKGVINLLQDGVPLVGLQSAPDGYVKSGPAPMRDHDYPSLPFGGESQLLTGAQRNNAPCKIQWMRCVGASLRGHTVKMR